MTEEFKEKNPVEGIVEDAHDHDHHDHEHHDHEHHDHEHHDHDHHDHEHHDHEHHHHHHHDENCDHDHDHDHGTTVVMENEDGTSDEYPVVDEFEYNDAVYVLVENADGTVTPLRQAGEDGELEFLTEDEFSEVANAYNEFMDEYGDEDDEEDEDLEADEVVVLDEVSEEEK